MRVGEKLRETETLRASEKIVVVVEVGEREDRERERERDRGRQDRREEAVPPTRAAGARGVASLARPAPACFARPVAACGAAPPSPAHASRSGERSVMSTEGRSPESVWAISSPVIVDMLSPIIA